jgi:hypothetical protein
VLSYRPVRLPLTTCTSPLIITRIVNTHFGRWSRLVDVYSTQFGDDMPIGNDSCAMFAINLFEYTTCNDFTTMYDENMVWLRQHWFSHRLWCWSFRRPQMWSENYAFIWLQLPCDSGFGAICVEIRRSRACQEQIQRTQISIRSLAYCLFQAPCQRWLPRRCVWRVTTYGPCVLPKNSTTVQHNITPLKACLHSYMYLLSYVNWMDKKHALRV